MNFSEIAAEDDKDNDEDKASLPDTEVGEVEDFSLQQLANFEAENEDADEDEPESKKPKYLAVVKKRTKRRRTPKRPMRLKTPRKLLPKIRTRRWRKKLRRPRPNRAKLKRILPSMRTKRILLSKVTIWILPSRMTWTLPTGDEVSGGQFAVSFCGLLCAKRIYIPYTHQII